VTAFYVFPRETVAPIFIIFLGLGLAPKIALSAFAVFFVVYINALAGARQVDKDLMNVMRVSGASRWHLFEIVIVPATIPWIFTGMRIAIRFAFTNTLFGEMLSGNRGLGFVIRAAANNMEASEVFAGILVVMVVNVLLGVALQRAERFATRWKI
jgi:NitT/TauT family transport system permease protein